LYMFNKGHGAGYALISEWMMYHKVKHPTEYWYSLMKYEIDPANIANFLALASIEGVVVFLPHVNYTADYTIRQFEGETVIQQGLLAIKGVGEKAAAVIEEERRVNGYFKDIDDFLDRVPKRSANSGVVKALEEAGALLFKKEIYLKRVVKYNSALYQRGVTNNARKAKQSSNY